MSTTILGLIIVIAAQFVPMEEIQKVIEGLGILMSWYGRFKIGDISPLGIRK